MSFTNRPGARIDDRKVNLDVPQSYTSSVAMGRPVADAACDNSGAHSSKVLTFWERSP